MLNDIYQKIANKYRCNYVPNTGLTTGIDGIHLDIPGHAYLASELVKIICDYK